MTSPPISLTTINADTPLPPLAVITAANAGKIQLLKTLPLSGFSKNELAQCSVAFSPDGKLLSGVCYQNTIPVWDAQSGQLVRALEATPVQEVAVAFSPDGKMIATGGFAGNIRVRDSASGQLIRTIGALPSPVWEVAFSPDGTRLAAVNFDYNLPAASDMSAIHLWNVTDGNLLWDYKGTKRLRVLSVNYAPDGKTIAFGTFDSVLILDTETGALIRSLPIPNHVGDLAFSPDGKFLATASDDHKIRLWRTDTFELVATLTGHAHYVNGAAFSSDGGVIVSGSHDKKVGIWDAATGRLLTMLTGHEAEVLRVAVNPAGTLIASVSWDGTVRLWGIME